MASFHMRIKSGKKGTAAQHSNYISRDGAYKSREDLVASGYGNMPGWATTPKDFWRAGDKFERANGAVYREYEIGLPVELTPSQRFELADKMIKALVGNMPFEFALHDNRSSIEGCSNPHMHLMHSTRLDDGYERTPEQTFRRHNAKHPELGGRKKASGGRTSLELRDEVISIRRICAELQNEALARHGHTARVDHRTLKQQGVERTPERHLGQAKVKRMTAAEKEQYAAKRKEQ